MPNRLTRKSFNHMFHMGRETLTEGPDGFPVVIDHFVSAGQEVSYQVVKGGNMYREASFSSVCAYGEWMSLASE